MNDISRIDVESTVEKVVISGDLSQLDAGQRVTYYKAVCDSMGLNPLTRPFDYITLNNRLTLYARKDATDQLRKIHNISIEKPDIQFQDEWIIVTVVGNDGTGRKDSDVGVVNKKDMRGDFGNALMKAVTKAKRRLTLSICGLGMLDETEIETIPTAVPSPVDIETGEVVKVSPPPVNLRPNADKMTIEVLAAFNRLSSDGTMYGDHTDEKLGYMERAIDKKLAQDLKPDEQDECMAKLEAIDIIRNWRKANREG